MYLEPEASYAEAQALARVQGDALSVSAQTLRKRLHERLVLVSTDESRQTLTVRRKLAEQQRSVLHVHIQTLSIDPEKPDKPDIGEANRVGWEES